MNTDKKKSGAGPAVRYLEMVKERIGGIRRELPQLIKMGEQMAGHLLAGGELFTPAVAKFWPSEFGGRAGGLMGIRAEERIDPKNKNNVAYFALPRAKGWDPRKDEKLKALIASSANLFVVGRYEDLQGVAPRSRFGGFTGGGDHEEGLGSVGEHRPLASLRELETFVRGWVVAGEMFAACTRGGRTPVLWMSVWLEGALPRNGHFFRHDNLREPWESDLFHAGQYVPPLKAGVVANEFIGELEKIHAVLLGEAGKLATAGKWLAEMKKAGGRIWTVAVGHSYPELLELSAGDGYPLEWGASFSDLTKAVPGELGEGDVMLHFGYAPVDNGNVRTLLGRGMRLIHTSPYGNHVEPVREKGFLYFELPWRPGDATVDVPGYSVRVLPMSSSAQTMALFAILAEMGGRMGWG